MQIKMELTNPNLHGRERFQHIFFKMIYLEAFDVTIRTIEQRLTCRRDQVYSEVLELPLKSIICKDIHKLEAVCNFYFKDK